MFTDMLKDNGRNGTIRRSFKLHFLGALGYSCLENSMDRGAWRAIVHEVAKIPTRLSGSTHAVSLVPADCHGPGRRRDCAQLGATSTTAHSPLLRQQGED